MKFLYFLFSLCSISFVYSQTETSRISLYDGIVVAGYVNQGVFLNFTGPNINFKRKNSKFILGMLPSLRFKDDSSTPKNAFVTPNLGVGFTWSYRTIAFQVPLYYNSKTSTENGKWHFGIGMGIRLNEFKQKNKNDATI